MPMSATTKHGEGRPPQTDTAEYPEWSRAIEEERRLRGISCRAISATAGHHYSWWNRVSMRVSPPPKWNEDEQAILNSLQPAQPA